MISYTEMNINNVLDKFGWEGRPTRIEVNKETTLILLVENDLDDNLKIILDQFQNPNVNVW